MSRDSFLVLKQTEATVKTFVVTAAALLISTASFAQTPAHTPSEAAAPIAAAGDWSAAKMKGVNVYNEANDKVGEMRVYLGDAAQSPDPLIQAVEGTDRTPAYRGLAYVVMEQLYITPFGNRLPNLTFELET